MSGPDMHPLLHRLLRRVGASADAPPSKEQWQQLLEVVSRTYKDADQDRYTIERAMDVSSREMEGLYAELQNKTQREIEMLRLLFSSNPLPMWVTDCETLRFVEVNEAMVLVYGYSRDELLAMPAQALKFPGEADELVTAIRGASVETIEHVGVRRHRRKDGAVLEIDITQHGMMMDGRLCAVAIGRDMTQERRVEEELRQAQKMEAIGRLAGGVAHDFNNILGVILGNTELAADKLGEAHSANEELKEVTAAALHASRLTHQLLTFSRKQRRAPKPLALNSIVTGVEGMLARIVGEDIAMSATIAPDLGTIEADPGELEQVIMNLVVNARDAMPDGGTLSLETKNVRLGSEPAARVGVPAGRYVVLRVTDTGCGMTEAVRVRIFEPFFTTKDVNKGTGLGLATVFGIVQQCQGGISVISEVGRGTTFEVYFPRTDVPAAAATKRDAFVPVRGSGTVLLVEDDQQLRKVLHRYLTSWGYDLLEAPNGLAAMELVRAFPGDIELLLTDLVMPGMDGRTLSRKLLELRPDTRVVFMSGYTEHPALASASIGPNDLFVHKPFSASVLNATLARARATHSPGARAASAP